jgi:hypothetical protein
MTDPSGFARQDFAELHHDAPRGSALLGRFCKTKIASHLAWSTTRIVQPLRGFPFSVLSFGQE